MNRIQVNITQMAPGVSSCMAKSTLTVFMLGSQIPEAADAMPEGTTSISDENLGNEQDDTG